MGAAGCSTIADNGILRIGKVETGIVIVRYKGKEYALMEGVIIYERWI